MQFKVVCCKLFGSLTLITFLLACANTTRSGAVGVNRSQFLAVSASEVDRLSAISFNEQNKKAKEKFQLVYYKINLMFFSVNLNKDLLWLKKLNDFLFSDVKVKVIYQINKKLLVKMLRLNPNSFKNLKKNF